MTNLFPAYSSAIGGMKMDCDCEFDKYEDEPDEEPLHYLRTCIYCGEEWDSLHCPHSGYQNPCPECNTRNYKENNMHTPLSFYDARTTAILDDLKDLEDRNYMIYADSFGETVHHVATGVTKDYAEFIVRACNSHADLFEALEEIAEGKGVYSLDKLTHAHNVVENLVTIAKQATEKAKGE